MILLYVYGQSSVHRHSDEQDWKWNVLQSGIHYTAGHRRYVLYLARCRDAQSGTPDGGRLVGDAWEVQTHTGEQPKGKAGQGRNRPVDQDKRTVQVSDSAVRSLSCR